MSSVAATQFLPVVAAPSMARDFVVVSIHDVAPATQPDCRADLRNSTRQEGHAGRGIAVDFPCLTRSQRRRCVTRPTVAGGSGLNDFLALRLVEPGLGLVGGHQQAARPEGEIGAGGRQPRGPKGSVDARGDLCVQVGVGDMSSTAMIMILSAPGSSPAWRDLTETLLGHPPFSGAERKAS